MGKGLAIATFLFSLPETMASADFIATSEWTVEGNFSRHYPKNLVDLELRMIKAARWKENCCSNVRAIVGEHQNCHRNNMVCDLAWFKNFTESAQDFSDAIEIYQEVCEEYLGLTPRQQRKLPKWDIQPIFVDKGIGHQGTRDWKLVSMRIDVSMLYEFKQTEIYINLKKWQEAEDELIKLREYQRSAEELRRSQTEE